MEINGKFLKGDCYLYLFPTNTRLVLIVLLISMSYHLFSQGEIKKNGFSIQAGINTDILSDVVGPSFSFHYAIHTNKVLQLESMLFFDSHSGRTFLSGYTQENRGAGLVAGVRINVLPKKKWNPSLLILGGAMYSTEKTSLPRESGDLSGALSLGVSSSFFQKHMVSLGYNAGRNISALHLKYGFWF